jgi:hypothetical protein
MILATLCYVKRESGMGLSSGRTAFRRPMAENGRLDVAYDLLTRKTIPSWLYAVTKGATTI